MSDTLLPQPAGNDTLAAESITDAELAALRVKAAAFDWLAAQIVSVEWVPRPGILYVEGVNRDKEFHASTLAEAVRLAMEAEGER